MGVVVVTLCFEKCSRPVVMRILMLLPGSRFPLIRRVRTEDFSVKSSQGCR
jgi:hypothetical protein